MNSNLNKKINNDYNITDNKKDKVIKIHETLVGYIEEFLLDKGKRSKKTSECYRGDINKLAKEMFGYSHYKYIRKQDFEAMGVDDLIQYFDACHQELKIDKSRKYANSTINRRMSSLKSLLGYLVARKKIKYEINDLMILLKSLPDNGIMIDVLSEEDANRCVDFFKTLPMGNILHIIGKLALDTALRANELLTLEWNQFTIFDDKVVVKSRGENRGKGNKSWEDEISLDLYNEILKLKEDDNKKVFNISYAMIAKSMNITTKALNLRDKKYTFHSFRKTSITHTFNVTGGDIIAAKEKANHSNIGTTTRYIKPKNYGMTGMFSLRGKMNNNLYKTVSHEELICALDKMDKGLLFQLNKELLNSSKENLKNNRII